jgi:hypothetical protein
MAEEPIVAVVTLTALLAAVLLGVGVAVRSRGHRTRPLRWAALALTVAVAAVLAPYTVADSGAASLYLLGVPVVAAAVPVLADRAGTPGVAADVGGVVLLAGWALLLGLGIGAAFLPGAFLLIVVLVLDLVPRRPPVT